MPLECYKEILESAVLEACEDELNYIVYDEHARICNYEPYLLSKSEQDRLFPQVAKEIERSISEGLDYLIGLTKGSKPDYDHVWGPLLHASWYHLRHVNFLQTGLVDQLKQYAKHDEIRVIDYGCGTMPVMWAIALVLADPENKLTHQKVSIYNHDRSKAMKRMGYTLYTKLKEAVESKQDLDEGRLYEAISRVEESNNPFNSNPHLLTAIHCLYDKETCEKLKERAKEVGIKDEYVTLHWKKAESLGLSIQKPVRGQWLGNLEDLTKFRKDRIGGLYSGADAIPWPLTRDVKWDKEDVVQVNL